MYAVEYRAGISEWRPLVRCASPVAPRVTPVELLAPVDGWCVGVIVRTPRSALQFAVSAIYDGAVRVLDDHGRVVGERWFRLVPGMTLPMTVAWRDRRPDAPAR